MNRYDTGDVVRLMSGGPWMTVRQTETERELVRCNWIHDGVAREAVFHERQLYKASAATAARARGVRP